MRCGGDFCVGGTCGLRAQWRERTIRFSAVSWPTLATKRSGRPSRCYSNDNLPRPLLSTAPTRPQCSREPALIASAPWPFERRALAHRWRDRVALSAAPPALLGWPFQNVSTNRFRVWSRLRQRPYQLHLSRQSSLAITVFHWRDSLALPRQSFTLPK